MQCPIDASDLVMSDRQGIEIDYCPKCRGVWLDRGELDKIIERSEPERSSARDAESDRGRDDRDRDDRDRDRDRRPEGEYRGGSSGYPQKKKKSSVLSELFDF